MNKKILVVEDNPANMRLVSDLLEINNYAIIKAYDGETAVNIIKNVKPDLILLDIILPGIDGFEVFKKIREDKNLDNVKVIAFTASAMEVDEKKIIQAGFDGYIKKPIDTKVFIQEIKKYLC